MAVLDLFQDMNHFSVTFAVLNAFFGAYFLKLEIFLHDVFRDLENRHWVLSLFSR